MPDRTRCRSATGNFTAEFICNIPRSVSADGNDPVTRARRALYGHGLLGNPDEVNAGNVRTMSNDAPIRLLRDEVVRLRRRGHRRRGATLQDVSNFPKVADRTQQGFLNQLFLARLVKDPQGFAPTPRSAWAR